MRKWKAVSPPIKDRLSGERTGPSYGWDVTSWDSDTSSVWQGERYGGMKDVRVQSQEEEQVCLDGHLFILHHLFLLPTPLFFLHPAFSGPEFHFFSFSYTLLLFALSSSAPLLSLRLSSSVLRRQYFDSFQTIRKEPTGLSYGMPVCVCVCVHSMGSYIVVLVFL